jgi:hypothetical protein
MCVLKQTMTLRRHFSVFSRLAAARRRCWGVSTQEAWGDQAETDQPDTVVTEQEEGSREEWGVGGGSMESVSRNESGRGKREYICGEGAGGSSRSEGGEGGGGDQSVISGGAERQSEGARGGGEGEGRDSEGLRGVIKRYVALSLATQMHPKNTKVR